MMGKVGEPLFEGLVFSEDGRAARAASVGGVPHYAIPDGDFLRHVEADRIDHEFILLLQERARPVQDEVAEAIARRLGQNGLFTAASVRHAIENLGAVLQSGRVDLGALRTALRTAGLRVIVDVHGNVVRVELPGWAESDGAGSQ
jgi:hypothetical protein